MILYVSEEVCIIPRRMYNTLHYWTSSIVALNRLELTNQRQDSTIHLLTTLPGFKVSAWNVPNLQ